MPGVLNKKRSVIKAFSQLNCLSQQVCLRWLLYSLLTLLPLSADARNYRQVEPVPAYTPVTWERFIPVAGQELPVPGQWLVEKEARIAHDLKLPDIVPTSVPFDFDQAWWRSWLPGTPHVAVQYHQHLCNTEAGQWIFKTVNDVEGLYFARPQGGYPKDGGTMTDPYGPEAPWIQRMLWLTSDRPLEQGAWFVYPSLRNYRFVEQPRREVKWQVDIREPYVRLFGYTRGYFVREGQVSADWNQITPMQVIGIPRLSARYGYTWRGLRRKRDREFGIAGTEVLIYDLQSFEVLAVRRQFLRAGNNPRGKGKAMWELAAKCTHPKAGRLSREFEQFAFDVLQTPEPSSMERIDDTVNAKSITRIE